MGSVFIFLGLVGFIFLVVSSFLGGDHDGILDGALDALHIDHAEHGESAGPSIFSAFAMSFFLMGFGGVGWMMQNNGYGPYASVGAAVVAGASLWGLAFAFMTFMYGQQSNSLVTTQNLLGQVCSVVIPINPGGVGKIQCSTQSGTTELLAISDEREVIPSGTSVRIVSFGGDRYVVERFQKEVKS
ncbi:MAG: NfeD family protein [Bacteroidota bacterium]